MGMFDGDGYDPTSPADQVEQYKKSSNPLGDLGLMTSQQKQMQAIQMQNQLAQMQLARQQQMLGLQSMQQNMGVNAAGLASGFNAPMLMAMGGLQPAFAGPLTKGINALIDKFGPNSGMTPMGQQALQSQNLDDTAVLNYAMQQAGGDTAKGYRIASQLYSRMGRNDVAANLQIKANEIDLANQQKQATIGKTQAETEQAKAQTAKTTADITKPENLGEVHNMQGMVGRKEAQFNTKTGKWEERTGDFGLPLQYTLPELPGDMSKDIVNFRTDLVNTEDAIGKMRQLRGALENGAAQGWTADIVNTANNVLGTLGQFIPQDKLDKSAVATLDKYTKDGTFANWADKTGINESRWADLTMALAASMAEGGKISNKEIARAQESLGENFSNPRTVSAILQDVEKRAGETIDRKHSYLKASTMPAAQKTDIDNLYGNFKQRTFGTSQQIGQPDADGWVTLPNGIKIREKR
jgi:hypothetical protein